MMALYYYYWGILLLQRIFKWFHDLFNFLIIAQIDRNGETLRFITNLLRDSLLLKLDITFWSPLNSIEMSLYENWSYKNFPFGANSWYFDNIIDIYDIFLLTYQTFLIYQYFSLCPILWRIYVYDSLDIFHAFIWHFDAFSIECRL